MTRKKPMTWVAASYLRAAGLGFLSLCVLLLTHGCSSGPAPGEEVAVQQSAITQCSDVPPEYVGADDGCDCPADGSPSCDPDCQLGNAGGQFCGCEYCYGEPVVPDPPTFPTLTTRPNVAAPALKTSNAVGRLPGISGVTNDGAYTYAIPLEVPAGRAGMQPEPELRYNSRDPNGLLGMGWSLAGAGASITRCPRIQASGGLTNGITWNSSDRFCLDGKRLLVVAGAYGALNSEYRTEVDEYTKVVITNVAATAFPEPGEFKVYYKDGRIGTFTRQNPSIASEGLNADGTVSGGVAVTYAWPITKLVDRTNNAMIYGYEMPQASPPLLRTIDYTACDTTPCAYPSPKLRRFELVYENRAASDQPETYLNGARMLLGKRVKEIKTSVANGSAWDGIHRYAFTYLQAGVSGRTLLTTIQQCDAATTPVCVPPTSFSYNGYSNVPFVLRNFGQTFSLVQLQGNPGQLMPENNFAVFDVNGDGNDDVILKSWTLPFLDMNITQNARDLLLLGDGFDYFAAPVSIDPDGDNTDKLGCTGAEVMDPASAQAIDLDGDGRKEWVIPLNTGCPFVDTDASAGVRMGRVQPGTSSGLTSADALKRVMGTMAWDPALARFTKVNMPTTIGGLDGVGWSLVETRVADMNGDALPDILYAQLGTAAQWSFQPARRATRASANDPQVDYLTLVGPSNPTGTLSVPMIPVPSKSNATFEPTTFRLIDENGDGRAELMQIDKEGKRRSVSYTQDLGTLVYRYRAERDPQAATTQTTPAGQPAAPTWGTANLGAACCNQSPGYWFQVDVNGDGLKDAIYSVSNDRNSAWQLRINTGTGYKAPTSVGPAAATLQTYPKDQLFEAGFRSLRGRDIGLRIVDMNGDGRDDLVLLDPLTETQAPPNHASGYQVAQANTRICYSNGTGFDAPVTITATSVERLYRRFEGFLTQFGDLNGDGLPEIIEMAAAPNDPNTRRLVTWRRFINPGGLDVMISVNDERGQAQSIEYDNLSAGTAKRFNLTGAANTHTPDPGSNPGGGACKYPARCTATGGVVRTRTDYRSPRTTVLRYNYAGARVDVAGRGWLGFTSWTELDTTSNFITQRNFDLAPLSGTTSGENGPSYHLYPLVGVPIFESSSWNAATAQASDLAFPDTWPLRRVTKTYTMSGYPVRLTRSTSTTSVYESLLSSGALRRTYGSTTDYDNFGNPVVATLTAQTSNSTVNSSFSATTTTNYANTTSTWLIGLATSSVQTTSTTDDAFGTGCVGTSGAPCSTTTRTTGYDYETSGLLKRIIREPNASATSGLKQTTEFVRDSAGLPTSVKHIPSEAGAATRTETLVYDTSGVNVIEHGNPLGHKTWFYYQPRTQLLYGKTDQNGPNNKLDVLVTHDNLGRAREINRADGARETTDYGLGVVRRAVDDGPSSATFFDLRGRPEIETWSMFSGNGVVEGLQYDSLGNLSKVQYRDSGETHAALSVDVSHARAMLAGAVQRMAATYDALGRLRTHTNGTNEVTAVTYPAPFGSVRYSDPSGNVRKTFADHSGRMRQFKQTLAGTSSRDLTTSFAFQDQGLLGSLKTPDNGRETRAYDALGRVLERRQFAPSGAANNVLNRRFVYTSLDEVAADSHGGNGTGVISVGYQRDALGRITQRTETNGDPNEDAEKQRFTYDPAGAVGALKRAFSLGASSSYAHLTTFGYDSLGRPAERRETFASPTGKESLSFGYTYDVRGRLDTLRYPETTSADVFAHPATGGLTVKYEYRNGQLKTIRDNSLPATDPPFLVFGTREPFGSATYALSYVPAGGAAYGLSWTRDPATLRLSDKRLMRLGGGVPLSQQSYSYYPNGLLKQRLGTGNLQEDYVYDSLSRLKTYDRRNTAVTTDQRIGVTFSYDDAGNITVVDTTASQGSPDWPNVDESYAFSGSVPNFATSQTIGSVTTTYVPDEMGRVAEHRSGSQLQRAYTYTSFDLPRTIEAPAANRTVTFAYSALGERTRKTTVEGSAISDVAYLGNLYEQRKTTTGGTTTGSSVFRIPGEDGVLAELVHPWTQTSAGTRSRNLFHNDHQGSPLYSTDGTTSKKLGFLPYGKRAGTPPASPLTSAVGYTSHIGDDDLGLINMRGRVYDVTQRRFVTRDPTCDSPFIAGGTNPYGYAAGNPIGNIDPNGFTNESRGGGESMGGSVSTGSIETGSGTGQGTGQGSGQGSGSGSGTGGPPSNWSGPPSGSGSGSGTGGPPSDWSGPPSGSGQSSGGSGVGGASPPQPGGPGTGQAPGEIANRPDSAGQGGGSSDRRLPNTGGPSSSPPPPTDPLVGRWYGSADMAAYMFLTHYNPRSIQANKEIYTLIVKRTGADGKDEFGLLERKFGSEHSSDGYIDYIKAFNASHVPGLTLVAGAHTHGRYSADSNDRFSGVIGASCASGVAGTCHDALTVRVTNIPLYLGTPFGNFSVLNPGQNAGQQPIEEDLGHLPPMLYYNSPSSEVTTGMRLFIQ